MADSLDALNTLAQGHQDAATHHDAAAHHHRQAAYHLAAGEGARARQHAMLAEEHAKGAQQAMQPGESFDEYDLDVDVQTLEGDVQPMITSKSLCTPGCTHGSGRSFCCSFFGTTC